MIQSNKDSDVRPCLNHFFDFEKSKQHSEVLFDAIYFALFPGNL